MNTFFDEDVLLSTEESKTIYSFIKDLDIIDYHCHLDPNMIKNDSKFNDIGELWLSGDHYKWRAMRLCGIDEKYITGNASYEEKFYKYASIVPKLMGNPLYYWTHLELQQVFGINKPLNSDTAKEIYLEANEKIKNLSVRKMLNNFKVKYVATTNDPIEDLASNGKYDDLMVAPTFRPDKLYYFDKEYISLLGKAANIEIKTLNDYKNAIKERLDFFVSKGCKITDHGFYMFPKAYASDSEANEYFNRLDTLNEVEKDKMFGWLLVYLMKLYKERNLIMQIHFSVLRNVNQKTFKEIGVDSGFDIIGEEIEIQSLINFLNQLDDNHRPNIILYTLNFQATRKIACISGAFRNVYCGAAWWFNDTLSSIKKNLDIVSEYALIGTNLGMLTDSRSFSSYSRFDFFRRILADFIGRKINKGEYTINDGIELAKDISYFNIKKLLEI